MICGILVLPSCFTTLLPALIMGHIAMSRAPSEGGNAGRAKLGLIFGYGSLVMLPVIAVLAGLVAPLVIRQRQKADQVERISHVRQIGMALEEYRTDRGSYPPDLKLLQTEGITTNIDELLAVNARNDGEWLYFPKADTTKPNSHLLISPLIHRMHVVLQVDGSVRPMDKARLPAPEISGEDAPVRIPAPRLGGN